MFGQDNARSDVTGSIPSTAKTAATTPADADLVYARAAATQALAIDGKTTSVPWENPQTGARGTITPLAAAYTQDGFVCRDFLASYVRQGAEVVVARRGLPRARGQVGNPRHAAVEEDLTHIPAKGIPIRRQGYAPKRVPAATLRSVRAGPTLVYRGAGDSHPAKRGLEFTNHARPL